MSWLADTDTGFPNARGQVHTRFPLFPETLRDAGAGTCLVGKWHLTPLHEVTPAGPFHNWPTHRGFDHFFGFLDGCTDQYFPEMYRDTHQLPAGDGSEHVTTRMADEAIAYVTRHTLYRPDQPFYLQFATGATHAPFEVARHYIEKYVSRFEKGWDAVREERLERQIRLGVTPPGTELTPRPDLVAAWDDLPEDERKLAVYLQATYAGFLEHTDAELGRIVARLDELGVLDDTIIMVFADNGASPEGGRTGAIDANTYFGRVSEPAQTQLDRLETLGSHEGGPHYPTGWSVAGNTPFRRYKQFPDLGGVRSPLVVSWPNGIGDNGGGIRDQFAHVIDLAPTILEALGVESSTPRDGASLLPTFGNAEAPAPRSTQYWEIFGHRALWHEGWRAVATHVPGADYAEDAWRLYNAAEDFSENRDLAEAEPERLEELKRLWEHEAERNQVFPLDDRGMNERVEIRSPLGLTAMTSFVLRPESGHVPFSSLVTGTDRSMRLTVDVVGRRGKDQGVLVASGGSQGGYSLYVMNDRLVFEHLMSRQRSVCVSDRPVPVGDVRLGFELDRHPDHSADVVLYQDGVAVGRVSLPNTSYHLSFWGLDVGGDRGSRVSRSYGEDFVFPAGAIESVSVDFLDEEHPAGELGKLLATE
jgi:arylsulfatase